MFKRNTNQRNLLVLTKIHNTKKQNTTEKKLGSPPQRAHVTNILIVCSPRSHQTQPLIHEDLHLHQPGISVPRCPVGYHSSKGNQSSGLTSELLREKEIKTRKLVNCQSELWTENHHRLLCAVHSGSGTS